MRSDPHRSAPAHELEALVFTDASRTWRDHGLIGDVALYEALEAADQLLDRARGELTAVP
jgi:hypothetical protein